MMVDVSKEKCGVRSTAEKRSGRRYLYEIATATIVYVGLIFASSFALDRTTGALKYVVSVVPVLGAIAIVGAAVRFTLRMDELQRQSFVTAAAIALAATLVATMTLGFLENAGIPRLSMTLVWPMAAVFFVIALPIVYRRYS